MTQGDHILFQIFWHAGDDRITFMKVSDRCYIFMVITCFVWTPLCHVYIPY